MNLLSPELPKLSSALSQSGNYSVMSNADQTALMLQAGKDLRRSQSPHQYTLANGSRQHRNVRSFKKHSFEASPGLDADPYLLVLLADQERAEGREEQAMSLIDAAFSAFDQTARRDRSAFAW